MQLVCATHHAETLGAHYSILKWRMKVPLKDSYITDTEIHTFYVHTKRVVEAIPDSCVHVYHTLLYKVDHA